MMRCVVALLSVGCVLWMGNGHKLPNKGRILTTKGDYISGSIPYNWYILSKDLSKCTPNNNNQEFLDEYTQCFDKLDKCLKKNDKKCVEETYGKLLYLKQTVSPSSYSGAFHTVTVDCVSLLLQELISSNCINLPYLAACIQPFFNEWEAVLN